MWENGEWILVRISSVRRLLSFRHTVHSIDALLTESNIVCERAPQEKITQLFQRPCMDRPSKGLYGSGRSIDLKPGFCFPGAYLTLIYP